jgi:flagellar biosynthesis protein FliQ
VIGLFQALTSIQELTLTFAPKVLAILAAVWLLGDFMARTLTEFLRGPLMTAMLGI